MGAYRTPRSILMHRILRTRRMFQARIPCEENQEAGRPILRATMARRHQFRDYGDSIPRKIWPFLCARFNRGDPSQIPWNYCRKRAHQRIYCTTFHHPLFSLPSLAPLPVSIKIGLLARTIHVAFSHMRDVTRMYSYLVKAVLCSWDDLCIRQLIRMI